MAKQPAPTLAATPQGAGVPQGLVDAWTKELKALQQRHQDRGGGSVASIIRYSKDREEVIFRTSYGSVCWGSIGSHLHEVYGKENVAFFAPVQPRPIPKSLAGLQYGNIYALQNLQQTYGPAKIKAGMVPPPLKKIPTGKKNSLESDLAPLLWSNNCPGTSPTLNYDGVTKTWLSFVFDPVISPWRMLLPHLFSSDVDTVLKMGGVVFPRFDLTPDYIWYHFLMCIRLPWTQTHRTVWWHTMVAHGIDPRVAFVTIFTSNPISWQTGTGVSFEDFVKTGAVQAREQYFEEATNAASLAVSIAYGNTTKNPEKRFALKGALPIPRLWSEDSFVKPKTNIPEIMLKRGGDMDAVIKSRFGSPQKYVSWTPVNYITQLQEILEEECFPALHDKGISTTPVVLPVTPAEKV